MYDQQQVFSDSLYIMVYGGSMVFALIACIYLLFRRSNAIAPEVTPPLRLRRGADTPYHGYASGDVARPSSPALALHLSLVASCSLICSDCLS